MNERHQQPVQQEAGGAGSGDHQPEVLHELQQLHAGRQWSLDEYIQRYAEAMAVRLMLPPEDIAREVRWFEQFEYGRAITQLHVEQVIHLSVAKRKETYKRWRADLGDEQARRYAKFAEYVIQNGRPKWFKEELTQFPDTNVLKPSSVSTALPVSWRPPRPTRTATRRW